MGLTSYDVVYQSVIQGTIADYIIGNGTDYFQLKGSQSLYILYEKDFQPNFDAKYLASDTISFVYEPEDSTNIDVTSILGTHFKGKADRVIAVTFPNKKQTIYSTSDYSKYPDGFYVDNWNFGDIFLGLGFIIIILTFFVPHKVITVFGWVLAGAIALPLITLVVVGITVPGGFSIDSFKSAISDDLTTVMGAAILGVVIGLVIGILQAIRGKDIVAVEDIYDKVVTSVGFFQEDD